MACQRTRPKREMIRVVRTPAGEVKVDPTGKLAGRGAYVCPEANCVETGVRGGRLQHALEVAIPDEIGTELQQVAADRFQLEGSRMHASS